jgi:Skp family chaperone for outer membrane proteins
MSGIDASDSGHDGRDGEDVAKLEREIDLSLRRADDATLGRPRARRSRGLIALAVILGLALVAAAALIAYLWRTTDEWRAESDRLVSVANEIAGERDTLTAELDQAQRDLEASDAQLREVQDRLLSLADERAQTGDELAMTQQFAQDVADVANQLESCVRGQEQLIEVLEEVERYDPESVAEGAEEISDACDQALSSSENLRRQLGVR